MTFEIHSYYDMMIVVGAVEPVLLKVAVCTEPYSNKYVDGLLVGKNHVLLYSNF